MLELIRKINFRNTFCTLNGNNEKRVDRKYVNLYVRVADTCQAGCKFCEFKNLSKSFSFDLLKFEKILKIFECNNIHVEKVSFTGGEPTLNKSTLKECLNITKSLKCNPFTVVNSNGYDLEYLIKEDNLDNISLSRHSVADADHFSIMGTNKVPGVEYLKILNTNKIHLTCNLISGYVDSIEKIIEYLNFSQSIGVYDVGFVGLMKINDFCKKNYVNFVDIIDESDKLICNKVWNDRDICRCRNYIFLPDEGNRLVKFYSRERCKNTEYSESNLVFDGKNLLNNFGGTVLY